MPCSPRKSTVNGRHKPQRILCLSRPSHILCIEYYIYIYLVGGKNLPLRKMMELKSVGVMKFPIYGKIKFMFQTTNQILYIYICMFFFARPFRTRLWRSCNIYIYVCIYMYIYICIIYAYIYISYVYIYNHVYINHHHNIYIYICRVRVYNYL